MKKSRLIHIRCRYLLSCMGFALMLGPMSVSATTVANFTAIVFGDDPFTGNNYFGTFSYDEAVLSNAGEETLDPLTGDVTVNFTFEGQLFDETNDINFNGFPVLEFIDGTPVFMDYLLVNGSSGVDFNDQTVLEISMQGDLISDGAGDFTIDAYIEVQAIPIPAALWLFSSGLLGLIGIARRKKAA